MVGCILTSMMWPLFSIIFGKIVNAFSPLNTKDEMIDEATKLTGLMAILGVICFFISFVARAPFIFVGEHMNIEYRIAYLKSLLS